MKVFNQHHARTQKKSYETVDPVSLTVPNQAESLKTILFRYTQGIALPVQKPLYHDGLDNFDEVDPTLSPAFDMADASMMILEQDIQNQRHKQKINDLRKQAIEEAKNKIPPKGPGYDNPDDRKKSQTNKQLGSSEANDDKRSE